MSHSCRVLLATAIAILPAMTGLAQDRPSSKLAFTRTAGELHLEALEAGGYWQAFPRDDAAAAIFGDGRWSRPPHPVTWKVIPRLAAPLALRRDATSGLTAVLMSRPNDCFAVSMPYGEESHRSVYLSLFGGDLRTRQEASARARLVIGKNISEDRALKLYRAYLKEPDPTP